MASSSDRPPSGWLNWLGRNRLLIAYALFGLGVAFALLALVLVLRSRTDYLLEVFLCALTALAAVSAGVWQMTRQPSELREEDLNRLLTGERPSFSNPAQDFFPRLIDPASDASLVALRRIACKMATGSGKTVVMSIDRKSTRLNSSHIQKSRMPSSA